MVYATIKKTDLLSGHGDHNDLVNTVKQQQLGEIKKVFLVHGDPKSMLALSAALEQEGYPVVIPQKGEEFDL
jgi:metallo-beta-lactamase family protein